MKYTIPGISLLVSSILCVGKKLASQIFGPKIEKIIEKLPLGWIFLCLLCLFTGILYADCFNERSLIRGWIREYNKIANVDRFVLANIVENKKSRYEAIIHIRFLSKLTNVNCTVEVTQNVGLKHAEKNFVIKHEVIPSVDQNLIKKIPVATFPIQVTQGKPVGFPFWGSDSTHTWAGDGRHIVTLKLSSGSKDQIQKFLISDIKHLGGGSEPVILFGGPESQSYMQIR